MENGDWKDEERKIPNKWFYIYLLEIFKIKCEWGPGGWFELVEWKIPIMGYVRARGGGGLWLLSILFLHLIFSIKYPNSKFPSNFFFIIQIWLQLNLT